MDKDHWTYMEVLEYFKIDEGFFTELEEERIVCASICEKTRQKQYPLTELEKLRIAKILFEELSVNMAGIEIILHMRQNMIDMRKQFDSILEDIANRLRERIDG